MNNYKVLLLTMLILLPGAVAADAKKEDAVKDEVKKLQGKWQVIKWIERDGTVVPADEIKNVTFEFKEDRVVKTEEDGRARQPLKFSVNPTKKPKSIDLGSGIYTIEGIYKLEGDELSLCLIAGSSSDQAPERPTEFKVNEKKHHVLFVMKKIKK